MLGDTIARLRKSRGLTQAKFAEMLHVTQGAISQWETGRTSPDVQQMFILADFFGVTVEALSGGDMTSSPIPMIEQKKDLPSEREIDDAIAALADGLTPDELLRVADFVAGLKAARKP